MKFTSLLFDIIGALGVVHLVKSAVHSWDRRRSIRRTWGGVKAWGRIRQEVVFVIGTTENTENQMIIVGESKLYGDILQFSLVDNEK